VSEIVRPDDLGKVKVISRGYSLIPELYLHGTSGGIVSSILYYLFDRGIIDSALVAFYDDKLNVYGDFITSKEEVVKHSGSYYQTSKQLLNIKKIHLYKSVAVVGLPCHIEALKRYAKRFNLKNIRITISLFCTIGRMRTGVRNYLKQKFDINLDVIKVSNYLSRYGKERLGKIVVKTQEGADYTYDYLELLDYLDCFYTPIGCFNCRKMFGLSADISVGDDWGIKTSRKIALIAANTEKGASLLNRIKMCGLLMVNGNKPLMVLLKSQPNGTAIKVCRPVETKILLILTKHAGLVLIKLRFPRKIVKLVRKLVLSHIQLRAY
jgi:coenzyme F420-reducing hydrogenase beta subunit